MPKMLFLGESFCGKREKKTDDCNGLVEKLMPSLLPGLAGILGARAQGFCTDTFSVC